jgi:hypothetical protein
VIHRIWLGDPMPAEYQEYGRRWLELNPGWSLHDWSEEELDWLANQELFARFEPIARAAQADVARYEILSRHGGVYVDTDVEPLRPLGDLFDGAEVHLVEQYPGSISNGIMAAVPGSRFFTDIIAALPSEALELEGQKVSQVTGPGAVQRAMARHERSLYPDDPERIKVHRRETFIPYSWHQLHLADIAFDRAFGVHHWARSWIDASLLENDVRGSRSRILARGVRGSALLGSTFVDLNARRARAAQRSLRAVGHTGQVLVTASDAATMQHIEASLDRLRCSGVKGSFSVLPHADGVQVIEQLRDSAEVHRVRIGEGPDQLPLLQAARALVVAGIVRHLEVALPPSTDPGRAGIVEILDDMASLCDPAMRATSRFEWLAKWRRGRVWMRLSFPDTRPRRRSSASDSAVRHS